MIGTCDPSTRSATFDSITIQKRSPNGSGIVTVDIRWTWDGTSVRPNCAGSITRVLLTNTSNQAAWVNLPSKASGNKWIQIVAGANSTTTNASQLNTMFGSATYSILRGITVVFAQPA